MYGKTGQFITRQRKDWAMDASILRSMGCQEPLTFAALAGAGDSLGAVWAELSEPFALAWIATRVAHEHHERGAVAHALVSAALLIPNLAENIRSPCSAALSLVQGVIDEPEQLNRSFITSLQAMVSDVRGEIVTAERKLRGRALTEPRVDRAVFLVLQAIVAIFSGWKNRAADHARDAVRELVSFVDRGDLLAHLRAEIPFEEFRTSWKNQRASA